MREALDHESELLSRYCLQYGDLVGRQLDRRGSGCLPRILFEPLEEGGFARRMLEKALYPHRYGRELR
jgi:hypothetical protein